MSITQVLKRMKLMVGKTYQYKGNQITVKDYHIMENNTVQIDLVDAKPINITDVTKFIDACLPVEIREPKEKEDGGSGSALSTEVVQQTNGLLGTLQATLLDNIEQVKKNPGYIKQANVVNSSVNALIGMAKLQIQVGKMKNK